MKKKLIRIVAWAFLGFLFLYFYFVDPSIKGSMTITCSIKKLTGFSCAGCGTQRALHELLHGNFLNAIYYNLVFVIGFPFFVFLYHQLIETYLLKSNHRSAILFSNKTAVVVILVTICFMILRNLPYYPFNLFQG